MEDAPPGGWEGLVQRADAGDRAARDRLFELLYRELHRLARREAGRFGAASPLSATTLLHEAYLDLSQREGLAFPDPAHFLAYAARAMRGIVIDRLRERQAQKRGGDLDITSLDTDLAERCPQPELVPGIGEALEELARLEPALAHLVDLKFFCGFSMAEIAALTKQSERTLERQWTKARTLLFHTMKQGP
jgi:RNA polymerase sigma factor (TIGR02999 family)